MEGPTPVSALIHAATMVTAGVYMVSRSHVIFERAPMALTVVAIIGTLTALFAATIGITQTDIKKVLAYSTVSQLGYMFMACGVGGILGRHFPSDDARLLQRPAVPGGRVGDSRRRRRAGHAADGRAANEDSVDVLDHDASPPLPSPEFRRLPASSARTKFCGGRIRPAGCTG